MKTMTEHELSEWVDDMCATAQVAIGEYAYVVTAPLLRSLFTGMKLVPANAVVLTPEQAEGIVSHT